MSYANDKVTERRTEAHAAAGAMSPNDLLAATRCMQAIQQVVQQVKGQSQERVMTQSQEQGAKL
jgi:hypothetical protein